MPIPPHSDSKKRRAMKAATVAKFDGRRVKNGRRGVREIRNQKFEGTEYQTTSHDENINGRVTNG